MFGSIILFLIPIINAEGVILEANFKHFISVVKEFDNEKIHLAF